MHSCNVVEREPISEPDWLCVLLWIGSVYMCCDWSTNWPCYCGAKITAQYHLSSHGSIVGILVCCPILRWNFLVCEPNAPRDIRYNILILWTSCPHRIAAFLFWRIFDRVVGRDVRQHLLSIHRHDSTIVKGECCCALSSRWVLLFIVIASYGGCECMVDAEWVYGEMRKPSINLSVYLLLPQSVCGTFEPDDIKIKKQFDFVESSYY